MINIKILDVVLICKLYIYLIIKCCYVKVLKFD